MSERLIKEGKKERCKEELMNMVNNITDKDIEEKKEIIDMNKRYGRGKYWIQLIPFTRQSNKNLYDCMENNYSWQCDRWNENDIKEMEKKVEIKLRELNQNIRVRLSRGYRDCYASLNVAFE